MFSKTTTSIILFIFLMIIAYPASSTQASAIMTMQSVNCKAGDTVKIPLTLQTGGENIAALQLDIHIDKTLFQITGVEPGPAATAANKIVVSNEFDQDTYRIGVISTDNINNITDGIIAYINLTINNSVAPQVISLYAESITGSDPVGKYVDVSILNYTILTDNYHDVTIPSGMYSVVFGSAGINNVTVKSGSRVECVNFPGANQINIEESSSKCLIKRSGATVYISGESGMTIKIPATKTAQTLKFSDGSFMLVITGGKVMLGSQEITTAETAIKN